MASISLRDVRVEYPIYSSRGRSLKTLILQQVGGEVTSHSDRILVTALDHITAEIVPGDRVALIGGNGAGKSTLLRVCAGIIEPTSGIAQVKGNVATFIDLSTGMDLDATGHENIITRAVFLGLRYSEAEALAAEVGEFSELGEFLDLPIRTYSSGMLMRLAFAISTGVSPEILVLDEHVGTGDAKFAGKMKARVAQLVDRARILVFATHDLEAARRMCTRGIVLKGGRVFHDGPIEDSARAYMEMVAAS